MGSAFFKYCFILLICLTLGAGSLFAANGFSSTTSFQIASLYHKMIGATPDFEQWALYTDEYKNAQHYDAKIALQEQEIKLKELYYNIFADEMISIQTSISTQEYSEKQEKLFLSTISPDTFFNYHAFGQNYAVIVPGIEKYHEVSLSEEAIQKFRDTSGLSAVLELTLKPEIADNVEPMIFESEEYWMILCKLAQIRIWDNDRQVVLWSEKADWYDNSNTQLLDLFAQ